MNCSITQRQDNTYTQGNLAPNCQLIKRKTCDNLPSNLNYIIMNRNFPIRKMSAMSENGIKSCQSQSLKPILITAPLKKKKKRRKKKLFPTFKRKLAA